MEKVRAFLFYQGEKVGLAVVLVVCLAVLVAARPWDTTIPEAEQLKGQLAQLGAKLGQGEPDLSEPDMIQALKEDIGPPVGVEPIGDAHLVVADTSGPLTPGSLYPRVAVVEALTVTPERGRIKLTWPVDPSKQAAENAQTGYTGFLELLRADVYRSEGDAGGTLEQVGTVPLDDVVIMPLSVGPVTGPGLDDMGPMYGMGGPSASALSPTELPEGKISSEDAQRAGRFAYADATVKPDRDYLYKVQLVAKNPRFEPTSPQDVPQFVESDLDATPLSLAQRALPSIRWFFIGGGEGAGQVRVYKWHVFTIPVSEMGEKLTDTEAASGQATVERADWVGVTFPVVRPGDVIGREEKRWFTARGTSVRQQLTIDFSTGATAVAVENAPRIEYAAAGDAATSRVVSSKLLLYYTDAEGALQTRWQETDLVPSERQVLLAGEAGAATGGPLEAGPVEGTGGQEGGYVSPERAASYRRMAEEAARRGEERFRAAQQEDEAMRRRMEREARRRSGGGY